jgi:SAM-dependent methyltransferase
MRDLSAMPRQAFDLVFHADSLAYIPDLRQVYGQVAQVLRPGGLYRVKHSQPAVHRTAWNGAAYEIAAPYAETIQRRDDGGIEFRHRMDDIFNGLLENGFDLLRVVEAPHYLQSFTEAEPGSWGHETRYVAGGFAIVAQKQPKVKRNRSVGIPHEGASRPVQGRELGFFTFCQTDTKKCTIFGIARREAPRRCPSLQVRLNRLHVKVLSHHASRFLSTVHR